MFLLDAIRRFLDGDVDSGWTRVDRILKVELVDGTKSAGTLYCRRRNGKLEYRSETTAEMAERQDTTIF